MSASGNTKAAVLEKLKSSLVIVDLQVPQLDVGQVLVEIHSSGICGAQLNEIAGANGEDKFLPHLLGHEGAGIVRDVGPGVTCVKSGDHVVLHWRKGAGIEAAPALYQRKENHALARTVGAGRVTTFSELAVVSENRVTSIDKDVPFDIAALMGCAVTTALGLINNEAQLRIGQSIAVAGCGGVGLNIIQAARMVSAYPIIAIDKHEDKLVLAKEFGATHAADTATVDLRDVVFWATGDKGVDVFADCTGAVDVIAEGYAVTSRGGRMILVGQPHLDAALVFSSMRQHFTGKLLMDSQGGMTNPTEDIPRYLRLYKQGLLNLYGLITHRYPLEQVNDALDLIRSGQGRTGRCILEIQ